MDILSHLLGAKPIEPSCGPRGCLVPSAARRRSGWICPGTNASALAFAMVPFELPLAPSPPLMLLALEMPGLAAGLDLLELEREPSRIGVAYPLPSLPPPAAPALASPLPRELLPPRPCEEPDCCRGPRWDRPSLCCGGCCWKEDAEGDCDGEPARELLPPEDACAGAAVAAVPKMRALASAYALSRSSSVMPALFAAPSVPGVREPLPDVPGEGEALRRIRGTPPSERPSVPNEGSVRGCARLIVALPLPLEERGTPSEGRSRTNPGCFPETELLHHQGQGDEI